jgi:hypothetical protein
VSGDAINTAITKSPFFAGFQWDNLLNMSMEAPFVPAQLSVFEQALPDPATTGSRKKSIIQYVAEAARSYLESTAASRNGAADPSKISRNDPSSSSEAQAVAESAETIERRRQFYASSKFTGDPNLFAGF